MPFIEILKYSLKIHSVLWSLLTFQTQHQHTLEKKYKQIHIILGIQTQLKKNSDKEQTFLSLQKSQQLYRDNELEEAWQQYRSEKLARKPRRQVRSSICFPIYKIHSIRERELSYISCFGCVFVLSICSSSLGPCDACALE